MKKVYKLHAIDENYICSLRSKMIKIFKKIKKKLRNFIIKAVQINVQLVDFFKEITQKNYETIFYDTTNADQKNGKKRDKKKIS